jgi:hypothetical protein
MKYIYLKSLIKNILLMEVDIFIVQKHNHPFGKKDTYPSLMLILTLSLVENGHFVTGPCN